MTTLADFRTRIRQDLHDTGSDLWTDAVLQRHIEHAVRDFSLEVPIEQKTTLQTTAGTRTVDVSSLTNRIAISAVEYPTGEYPPRLLGFSLWQDTLELDTIDEPSAATNVYVYWLKAHTVDGSGSTIESEHEDIIALGAAGYAALDWAAYAINRLNTGGQETAAAFKRYGEAKLREFRRELKRVSRRNQIRVTQLYTPHGDTRWNEGRLKY